MNTNEANAVRAAIDKLPGNDKRVLISDVYEARDILLSLLDASQPDDTAAHLQARIDTALADIEEWALMGVVDSSAIAERLEAILRGEPS